MTKDIYDLFMKHIDIIEIMIPPKRNIFGRRFRFTRFKKVEDEKLLAIRMDNIFIDNKKIHVNIPRFQRIETFGSLLYMSLINESLLNMKMILMMTTSI